MRRTIWLTAGVVLGIAGYRRVDRAVRSLTAPSAPVVPVRQDALEATRGQSGRSPAAAALSATIWTARQLRATRGASRAISAQVGGFLAEVRTGMDEYLEAHERNMNRQHAGEGSTLISQTTGRLAIRGRPAGNHETDEITDEIKDGR